MAKLVEMGEKDAVADARNLLQKANHPQANGTDEQALFAYRSILVDQDGGKDETANWRLKKSLETKIKVHL